MPNVVEPKSFLKQIDKSTLSAYYPLHKNANYVDVLDVLLVHDNGEEETYVLNMSHLIDKDHLYEVQVNYLDVKDKNFVVMTRVLDTVKEVEINPLFTEDEDMTIYSKIIHVMIVETSPGFNSTYKFVEIGQEYSELE